jgi:hypothetical protein
MELGLQHTFDRNDTVAAIASGKYSNVRIFLSSDVRAPYPDRPVFVASTDYFPKQNYGKGLFWKWSKVADAINATSPEKSLLMDYSASCWYFGKSLADMMEAESEGIDGNDGGVPLGMMAVSVGGTAIEQWVEKGAQEGCHNISCMGANCSSNAGLYNSMVAPYANMTVKGWIWCEYSMVHKYVCCGVSSGV